MSIFNTKQYLGAISGGPDSIALLNMYHRHIKVVCTVKYNKRNDCQYDVDCVKKICDKYKIPLEILDVTNEIYQQYEDDNNFQSRARKIRYDFFIKIAKNYHLSKILVAHHLDDFLETGYNQIQTNSKNLFYGIRDKSKYDNIEIIRPFINRYRKKTLQRYCDDLNLEYALDSSNDTDDYQRNVIRKKIQVMNNDQIYDLLKRIRKHNKNNKKFIKVLEKDYLEWKKINFSVQQFLIFEENKKNYLIYKYLLDNKFYRPNNFKIEGIILFLKNNDNRKQYRLTNNCFLIKEKGILKIKNNC